MSIVWLVLLWLSFALADNSDDALRFNLDNSVKHEESGSEFHIKKTGKMTGVIDLDEYFEKYEAIQNIKCVRKGIQVFIDQESHGPREALGGHYDITQVWKPGMIVKGGPSWEACTSDVDGVKIKGIFRKIKSLFYGVDHLFIMTEIAGFADNFEQLQFRIHHKRGNWSRIPAEEKEEHKKRVRRALVTDDDVMNMLTKNTHKKSIFEPDQHLSMDVNYNHQNDIVENHIRVDSGIAGLTKYKNEYFQIPGQTNYAPRNKNDWWDVYFEECYSKFEADFHLELVVEKNLIEKFEVKLSGVVEMKRKFQAHTNGKLSSKSTALLAHKDETVDIPLMTFNAVDKDDITVQLKYSINLYADIDMKFLDVTSEFAFDIFEKGQLDLTFTRQSDGTMLMTQSYQQLSQEVADPVYSFTVQLTDASVDLKTEVVLDYTINWGATPRGDPNEATPSYLFQLSTESGCRVGLSTKVDFPTYLYGAGDVCVRPTHDLRLDAMVLKENLKYKVMGKTMWDGELSSQIQEQILIRNVTEFASCQDDTLETTCCFVYVTGPSEKNADKEPEDSDACGKIIRAISRDMNEFFSSMVQMKSPDILFQNEEHTYSWCGSLNYPCADCRKGIAGYVKPAMCADRMMSHDLSESIRALASLVRRQYPKRKLLVITAWDEQNQMFPAQGTNTGKYAFNSIHKEGRAAELAITRELTDAEKNYDFDVMPTPDLDPDKMTKLGQLAVAADFDFVKIKQNFVHVGVKHGIWLTGAASKNSHFEQLMTNATCDDLVNLDDAMAKFSGPHWFPILFRGQKKPEGKTMDQACGAIGGLITRVNKRQFAGMYYYQDNDVVFGEGKGDEEWCGYPGRDCIDCRVINETKNVPPDQRCRARVMSHRLAFRMKKLACLVQQKWNGERKLIMEFGWDEQTSKPGTYKWGKWKYERTQYYEGRGAWFNVTGDGWQDQLKYLAQLAQFAGFDYVEFPPMPKPEVVWVCVKKESVPKPFVVDFPKAQLLVSKPGFFAKNGKYAYPGEPLLEAYLSQFFDISIYKGVNLGGGFTAEHFTEGGERFIRLDPTVVQCVATIKDKGLKIKVVAGYRNQVLNWENRFQKHPNELVRHQSGHAAIIKMEEGETSNDDLLKMGKAVIKICGNIVNKQDRMLGIGVHRDQLYFHIEPKPFEAPPPIQVEFWTYKGGDRDVVDDLEEWLTVIQGGPPIDVMDVKSACTFTLGEENYYFNIDVKNNSVFTPSECKTTSPTTFCENTKSERQKQYEVIKRSLQSKAKLSSSDTAAINALKECVVDSCGDCFEGPIWNKKVLNCLEIMNFYKENAGNPFGNLEDRLSIYNMFSEDAIKSLSTIACNKQRFTCVENTELFGMWAPVIRSRYKPDKTRSLEAELYGIENPLPIFDIIYQMLAMHAKGDVHVFIHEYNDLSLLKKVFKILMTYNKDVTAIKVYFSEGVATGTKIGNVALNIKKNMILNTIINAADIWAGMVCPTKARPAITKYEVVDLKDLLKDGLSEAELQAANEEQLEKEVLARLEALDWELKEVGKMKLAD